MTLPDIGIHLPITDPTWIFFLVLMIILFAPILLGRLRIPHIIGMILAGVVIGKYGFNILERDSSFELFGKVGIYSRVNVPCNSVEISAGVNHFAYKVQLLSLEYLSPAANAFPEKSALSYQPRKI